MSKKDTKDVDDNIFSPEQLLITPADAADIEHKFTSSYPRDVIVSLIPSSIILPIILMGCEKLYAEGTRAWAWTWLLVGITFLSGVAITMCIYYFYLKGKIKGLKQLIIKKSIEHADYTGIFLITKKCAPNSNGIMNDIELLAENDGFKYIVYLNLKEDGCSEDGRCDKENIRRALAKRLNMGSDYDKLKCEHLASENSIKHSHTRPGKSVIQIRYEFFHVIFEKDCSRTVLEGNKYAWKRLSELETDSNAWQNQDVLGYIKSYFSQNRLLQDSFPARRQLKIIWNIADTTRCTYKCNICATYSERESLSKDQKSVVLRHILSGKDFIKEIDFSGGDPLLVAEDRDIILDTISILGKEKVWVTTTGNGISKASKELDRESLKKLLYNCEISMDLEAEKHCREDYNKSHKSILSNNNSLINDNVKNLCINIPIIDYKVSEEDIKRMVESIKGFPIKNKKVNLLRLMEVGQMKWEDNELSSYNSELKRVVLTFCNFADENGLEVKLHCALRGIKDVTNVCTLRDEKIGIDCAGNVFSCAWAGYIKGTKIEDNKFYLGNIYENDLESILTQADNASIPAMSDRPRPSCCVYSYIYSQNKDPYDGSDPLFKK